MGSWFFEDLEKRSNPPGGTDRGGHFVNANGWDEIFWGSGLLKRGRSMGWVALDTRPKLHRHSTITRPTVIQKRHTGHAQQKSLRVAIVIAFT